jgi:hypothetical protein
MSPSRTRQQFVPSRPRSEIIAAVAVGVGIAGGTVLLIWLMRPGGTGVAGGGGLFNRQPRMTMLIVLTAAALGGLVLWVRRGRRPKRLGERGSIVVGSLVVIAVAVVAGIFWPGGVVRHWPKAPALTNPPATNPPATNPPATNPPSVPSTTPATSTGPSTTARTATTVKSTPTTPTTPTTKGR